MTDHDKPSSSKKAQKLTPWQLLQSVLAAFIGVQSEAKRKEDFEKITPRQVILAGIILMIVFFVTVFTITQSILAVNT